MSFENSQSDPLLNVPTPDCVVSRSRQEDFALVVRGQAGDCTLVILQNVLWSTSFEGPNNSRIIGRTCDEDIFVFVIVPTRIRLIVFPVAFVFPVVFRHKGNRVNTSFVTDKNSETFASIDIPASGGSIVGAAEEKNPRRQKTIDDGFVSAKNADIPERFQVPLSDSFVSSTAPYEPIVDGEAVNDVFVTFQGANAVAVVAPRRPQLHRFVVAS